MYIEIYNFQNKQFHKHVERTSVISNQRISNIFFQNGVKLKFENISYNKIQSYCNNTICQCLDQLYNSWIQAEKQQSKHSISTIFSYFKQLLLLVGIITLKLRVTAASKSRGHYARNSKDLLLKWSKHECCKSYKIYLFALKMTEF